MTQKTPVTILQVLPELNDGGVERGTVEMAAYIAERGGKSLVASSGGKRVADLLKNGAEHIELPLHKKNPVSVIMNAYKLRKVIKQHGVTHIHARSRGPAWSAYLCTRCGCAQFITTFHGTHGLKGLGKRFYNSVMVRGSVVVANSQFIADHIRNHYADYLGKRPLLVAPRGADTSVFHPDAKNDPDIRAELGLPKGATLIVQVGRLSRWKGQKALIEAVAALENPNVHVAFVGAPDTNNKLYLQDLKALSEEHNLSEKIHFVGSKSNVAAWYRAADIAVNASQKPEAFGRTTVEGMACGTLTIATAHGGSLEIIEDGQSGFLVPPADSAALAEALKRSVDHKKDRSAIAQNGVQRVQEKFTTTTMCEKEFSAYHAG